MSKETEEKKQELGQEQEPQPRPNRDAYRESFAEDYPDIDFEDKEARYGAMVNDRKNYKEMRKAGRELSDVFERNSWMASMFMDLKDNPDLDPITWMADNGIDINEAMQDEEYRQKIAKKIKKYQEDQLKGKEEDAQREENLMASKEALDGVAEKYGMDTDATNDMWRNFFENIIDPALRGEVSADTWELVRKANNYDADVANAREEGGIQARNEKIQNKLKKFDEGSKMPPTLSQGGEARSKEKPKEDKFFDKYMEEYMS